MTTDDRKHKMLIVEDHEGNRNALKMEFKDEYIVVEAGDIDKALEELNKPENTDIDIIIADKKLDKLSRNLGIKFLEDSKEKFPDAIRVLITGYGKEVDPEELINYTEIDLYYTKPLTDDKIEDLKLHLKKLLIKKKKHK